MSKGGMYFKAKRDDSEPEIVEAFRDEGCSVERMSGKGIPDLAVGLDLVNHWVECKSGDGELTADQIAWQAKWKGEPVQICRTAAQARKLVKIWRVAAAIEAEVRQRIQYGPTWTGTGGTH